MKIVFFGTPEIATPILEVLNAVPGAEIEAVITQPDKKVGRKQKIQAPPVKITAQKLGLKVLQPKNQEELEEELSGVKADFFVVIAYGMILTPKILKIPKYGCINIHFSLLPKYRGASPIQESLLHGDAETGISIIKMDEKLDHGNILLVKRISIEDQDTSETLGPKLAQISAEMLPLVLIDTIDGQFTPLPQDHKKATFCKKITKENGEINFEEQSAEQIKNMLRAYTPWPGIYCKLKDKKLKIIETEISDESIPKGKFKVEGKCLKIGTFKGTLLPKKLQMEGKNEMSTESFLNGYSSLFK